MNFVPPSDSEENNNSFIPPTDIAQESSFTPPTDVAQQSSFTPPVDVAPKKLNRIEQVQPYLQKRAEEKKAKEQTIPFQDLYKNDDYFNIIKEYAAARFGKNGVQQKGETKEQFVNRFATAMRYLNTNEINYFTENDWLNNAKKEDVIKAGKAYDLFDKTASFFSSEGQNPFRALKDYVAGTVSAPSTALSLGVGKAVTAPVASSLMKQGLKNTVLSRVGAKAIGIPVAIETGTNVSANLYEQRRDIDVLDAKVQTAREQIKTMTPEQQAQVMPAIEEAQAQVDKGLDLTQAVVTGAITAPVSLILETGPLLAAAKKPTKLLSGGAGDLKLDDILAARKKQTATGTAPSELTGDAAKDNLTITTHNVYDGGDLLDEQGAPTAIAQMQLKNSLDKQADLIAESIWKQMPEYAPKADEKVFEAVQRTLDVFDKLPDDVIKQSMTDAGTDLTNFMARLESAGLSGDELQKFSAMYGVSVSDAARTLQSKSVISRMQNKLRNIDPESAKQVDAMFGKTDPTESALSRVKAVVDKADRNMITAMTLNAGTVMRNAFGIGANSTYGAAEEAMTSYILSLGRNLAAKSGAPIKGDIGKGVNGLIDDAVDVWFYLDQNNLAKEITETALKDNPVLRSKMLVTAEEMKNSDLIAPLRILNTPAMLMDNYVRNAVFAASVETNMRRVGLDVFDVMAQDKNIPIDILRKAADDALEFTFSKTPTDKLGNLVVKFAEAGRPLTTVAVPFARFMVNATKWTLKHYNPGFIVTGALDVRKGMQMLKNGEDAGQQLILKGADKLSKQATGMVTLMAAIAYRAANQDTPWNIMKSDDGTTVDLKYLFPLNVPFALADYYYKTYNGNPEDFSTRALVEAVTGFKAVGAQGVVFDNAREAMGLLGQTITGNESDDVVLSRIGQSFGDVAGAWLARPFVPLNQVSDIFGAFDRNESLPRDIYRTAPGEERTFAQAVGKPIQRMIPILKQSLPEYQPATRTEAARRETGVFKQATGIPLVAPKNDIEAEIDARGLQYQDVFRTTGDKTLDSMARKIMAGEIENEIGSFIKSKEYIGADPDAKAVSLKARLGDLQALAKKEAEDQYVTEYYSKGKVPPIHEIRFAKLPAKVRGLAADLYKQETGKSLAENTSDLERYAVALELAKNIRQDATIMRSKEEPAFAGGGLLAKKVLKEAAPSVFKKAASALDDAMESVTKKALPSVEEAAPSASVFDQMSNVLKKEPAPTPSKPAVAAQTEQAIPAPTPKKEIAPTPSEAVDEYADDFFKDFEEADALYNEDPTLDMSYNFNDLSPIDPAVVGKGVIGTPIDKYTSIGGIDGAISIVRKERTDAFDKLRSDPDMLDINDSVLSTSLAKWREKDSARLAEDMGLPTDRRSPFYAPEFDIENATPEQFSNFMKIVNAEQKRYDKLAEKFKGRPPVTLFHGQEEGSKVMQNLTKKGFASPQTDPRKHAEMTIGAPSFTKDPNLNTLIPKFGGEDIGAYGSVNVPYAEYMYRRVNMPAETYDLANKGRGGDPLEALSIYNRAISGADDNAVPISLPKGYHLESEDMFIEADKLKSMGFSRPAARGGDKQARDQVAKAISEKDMTTSNLEKVGASYEKFMQGVESKRVSEKDLYKMYGDVRSLFKQELNRSTGTVSVTGGTGSRYVNTLRTMAEGQELTVPFRDEAKGLPIVDVLTKLGDEMSKLATRKESKSLAEKAKNIIEMRDLLTNIREQTVNKMGDVTPSSAKASSYSRGKIPESKMPLATSINALKKQREKLVDKRSKEWEEEVIDNLTYEIENIDADIAAKKEAIGPIESERSSKDKIMKLTDKLAKGGLVARRR